MLNSKSELIEQFKKSNDAQMERHKWILQIRESNNTLKSWEFLDIYNNEPFQNFEKVKSTVESMKPMKLTKLNLAFKEFRGLYKLVRVFGDHPLIFLGFIKTLAFLRYIYFIRFMEDPLGEIYDEFKKPCSDLSNWLNETENVDPGESFSKLSSLFNLYMGLIRVSESEFYLIQRKLKLSDPDTGLLEKTKILARNHPSLVLSGIVMTPALIYGLSKQRKSKKIKKIKG